MNEVETNNCEAIGDYKIANRVVAQDILFNRDGGTFVVRVGLPEYRQGFTDPEPKVLSMNDISLLDDVCAHLHQMPLDQLEPYLTRQEQIPD